MNPKIYLSIILIALLALVAEFSALAKSSSEPPPGLEERGPLTKITFIHYKDAKAKPEGVGKPPKNKETACYAFLANGAKWKTTEDYLINPKNPDGLSNQFVKQAIEAGVEEWEKYGGPDIFGQSDVDEGVFFSEDLDGENVAAFGAYPNANVIAIANVWGYFYGPPKTRELIEWDILFNTASDFDWGDGETNPALMDLQNIATHELGHGTGLDDLYGTSCIEETMYGYSTEGEISKRDLNVGDMAGIKALYQ